ncbi:3-hydroxyacyl-CoA dehydrogenase/enoyl-CoA hydratase family protein [Clostridium sp.]
MSFYIKKAAVIGAGVMGASIAAHIAGAGIPVCLLDIVPKDLTETEKAKGLTLDSPEVRNRFVMMGKERLLNPKTRPNLIYDKSFGQMIQVGNLEDNMDMIKEADWIIEVIVENLEIKKNLFKQISENRKPGSIVSSNTSGISINKCAEELPLEFRQHFLGTHFFNPPRYMKLLELIPCEDTLLEVLDFMKVFGTERLGKGVVLAKDTPNFIGNRLGTFGSVYTLKLMEKYGYDIAKVDKITGRAMCRPKSATFRTTDMVGIDIFKHVVNNVVNNVDDAAEKKRFELPGYIDTLISKGYLGDKSKQGFYKTVKTENGKKILMWDFNKEDYVDKPSVQIDIIDKCLMQKGASDKLKTLVYSEEEEGKFAWDLLKNILLYSATKVPEIADDFKEIDKACRWGFNWDIGPFEMWDAIGLKESVEKMKVEGDVIPEWVEQRISSGKTKFYNDADKYEGAPYILLSSPKNNIIMKNPEAALIDIGDGVACLEFNSKGNSLTAFIASMIDNALMEVDKNFKGLVIGNQGKNFCVGANLSLIVGLAMSRDWKKLGSEITKLQTTNMKCKYFSKPIVAAPFGMTLGGGAEVVMHSHKVVASAETYMGLVEVGVGLVPSGGGIKELLIRGTSEAAKIDDVDLFPFVLDMWKKIAMADVSTSGFEAVSKGYLKKSDRIVLNHDALIDEAKNLVLSMDKDGFRPIMKENIKVVGTTGKAALSFYAEQMLKGNYISKYDAHIANKIATVITGGNVPRNTYVSEKQILELEKEAFLSLCGEDKTLERIGYMLKAGKPLRN